ncbi:hypothetical protein R1sor_020275 [Riccia sorocarpa]|uniref:Uncharacterized protein n=1 Tax=Riccia sorocarpa TaxID=122646 RepID=A0ABD3IEV4_9MARC
MANLEETFYLSIHCRHGEEVLSTLHRYSRWQIEIWYRHFERLALSAPLPLAVHHSFVRDVILDEIYNRDRILAAAEDRAWVQEMPREVDGWDMLAAYGLPQDFSVQELQDLMGMLGYYRRFLAKVEWEELVFALRSELENRQRETTQRLRVGYLREYLVIADVGPRPKFLMSSPPQRHTNCPA